MSATNTNETISDTYNILKLTVKNEDKMWRPPEHFLKTNITVNIHSRVQHTKEFS